MRGLPPVADSATITSDGLEVRFYDQNRELALFQFVGDLLRSVALPVFFRRWIIATLQETTCFLCANDDRYRTFLATFLCMDFIRRNQIYLSGTHFYINCLPYFATVGFAAIIHPFVALDGLVSIQHTIESPIVSVVVNLRARSRRLDEPVDNKLILGIFVEQQILRSVCLGACRPVLGLLPDRRIGQQLLQQRRHFLPALRRIFFLGVKLASRLDKLLQRAHITSSNVRNEQLFQVIIIPTVGLRSSCPASGKTNRLSNPTPCWLTARINQDS